MLFPFEGGGNFVSYLFKTPGRLLTGLGENLFALLARLMDNRFFSRVTCRLPLGHLFVELGL